MIFLFAQAAAEASAKSVDAAFIGQLVIGLIQLLTLWKLVQRKPSLDAEFSTKTEREHGDQVVADALAKHVEEHKRDIENIFSKLGGHERGVQTALTNLAVNHGGTSKAVEIMGNQLVELGKDIKLLTAEVHKSR